MVNANELSNQELADRINSLHNIIARMERDHENLQAKLDMELQKNSFRLAVVVHIFYLDLMEEVCKYLKNIEYPFDLYISTQDQFTSVCQTYFKNAFPEYKVLVKSFPNIGRDVYPFLYFYQNYLFRYDLALKIHTKKSTHNKNLFLWREHLLENVVGSSETVRNIIKLFKQNERLGLVFPDHFPTIEPYIGFEMNGFYITEYLKKIDIDPSMETHVNFPSGTFFWFRPTAFLDLLRFGDLKQDFINISSTSTDFREGHLEHAFERIFYHIVKNRNFTQKQVLYNKEFGIIAQLKIIQANKLVDEEYYLNLYEDVRVNGCNPSEHYLLHGAREGRSPFPGFNTPFYKKQIRDEKFIKHICPVVHWYLVGKGRNYRINTNG